MKVSRNSLILLLNLATFSFEIRSCFILRMHFFIRLSLHDSMVLYVLKRDLKTNHFIWKNIKLAMIPVSFPKIILNLLSKIWFRVKYRITSYSILHSLIIWAIYSYRFLDRVYISCLLKNLTKNLDGSFPKKHLLCNSYCFCCKHDAMLVPNLFH